MSAGLCDTCSHKVACRREGRRICFFSCDDYEDIDEVTEHD